MSKKIVLNAVILIGSVVMSSLVMSSLAAEEKLTAEVRPVDGTPTLFINGKPHNPLIYMSGGWGRCVGSVSVRITTEWKSFETTCGMPEDQPNGSVYVQVGKVSGTTVWVDDVSLVDADEPQKNLIANADFSDTNWEKDWSLDTTAKEGAKAKACVEDGVLRLDVDGGGNEFRHVRIYYRGKLDLKKRHRYIYSLRLRASKERDADILVREQGGNWTVYSEGKTGKTLHTMEHAAREGVHIHLVSAVGMPWPRTGQQPDYRAAEWTIEQHLARDPQGLLIVGFAVDPPSWWKEKHPDDLMVWEKPSDRAITLKSVETAQSPLDWHRVRVELKGGSIKVYLDGKLEIDCVDPQPLTSGKVELNSLHARKCRFDDVKVSDFAGKTLFADDFSSGLEKWKAEEGRWHVEGGELVGEGRARLSAGESNWQDYVFESREPVANATLAAGCRASSS